MPLRPAALSLGLALALAAPAAAQQPVSAFDLTAIPHSAFEIGTAGAGSFAPTEVPAAITMNPALLATAARRPAVRATGAVTPEWLGQSVVLGTSAASIGVSIPAGPGSLALAVGAVRTTFDFGQIALTSPTGEVGTYRGLEESIGGGVAVGWSGPVAVDLGAALYGRTDRLPPAEVGAAEAPRAEAVSLDAGGLVTVDAVALAGLRGPDTDLTPAFELSIGAARRHDERSFEIVERPADVPEPEFGGLLRETAAGYSARVGLERRVGRARFRLVEAEAMVEGESLDGFPAARAVLAGAAGDRSAGRRGVRLTLLDTVTLRAGRNQFAKGAGATDGVGAGVSVDGLMRAAGALGGRPRLYAMAEILTLRLDVAHYAVDGVESLRGTTFGVTAGWRP